MSSQPNNLQIFMQMLMKEARRYSLLELMEEWGLTEFEYEEIRIWFENEHQVTL